MEIKIGTKGYKEDIVRKENTAAAIGSGAVEVFATPAMIALMENAALDAIAPFLEEDQSSVGTNISTSHLAASPLGIKVWATAEVIEVDRRRIVFAVKAFDENEMIGEGTHERFVIQTDKFLAKAKSKTQ
ncbi:MAG: thioesterase family protein [Clostridiales bacterium]|nr:thioesterase family protein [Clostridiales bacterium]